MQRRAGSASTFVEFDVAYTCTQMVEGNKVTFTYGYDDVGLCVAPSCDETILKAQFIDFYYMFFIRGLETQGFDCVTGTNNNSGVSAPTNSPAAFIMSVVAVMSMFLTFF